MIITGTFAPCTPSAASTPHLWMPMLQGVSISDATDQNIQNIIDKDLVALIDTGSDYCRIDQSLASKYPSLKQVGEMDSIGATGPGKEKLYELQIIFGTVRFQAICATAILRSGGSLFDLLIGMDAIRFFELSVVRARHQVTMTWIDQQKDR
jgi:hypothetical protein